MFDILAESCVHLSFQAFTRNDQAAAEDILSHVRPSDLVLRDLGYFAVKALGKIEAAGAFFVSRLRFGTSIISPETGKPVDFLRLLRAKGSLDMKVLLAARTTGSPCAWSPCRCLPTSPPRGAARALADRDKRMNPSAAKLELMGWEVFVTNVHASHLSQAQIRSLYGLRWRIEIIFKAWKSTSSRKSVKC